MKRLFTPELAVLTILSAITRFWHLSTPNAVVFDETYYKTFAGHYLARSYFFDLHPPLGKLLFAAVAHVFGVPASTLIGPDPVVILRVLPAFFGTLMVPLAYIILRQLDGSRRVASLGAFAVLCENALIVDSRLTLMEPFLIGFGLAAITLFLAARHATGRSRYAWLATSALMAGCALSVKWTGASALGLILAAWFFDAAGSRRLTRRTIAEGALLVAIPAAVYIGAFAIHFALLQRAGVGEAAASARVRATLIGEPTYDSTLHVSLFEKIADAHRQMNHANRLLSTPHPAASPWYTWPVMKHPIGLWQNTHPASGWMQSVILIGNPVIWWGGLVVVIVAIVEFYRRRELLRSNRFALAFLAGSFLINFVPFIGIRRTMFIYHYLFALVCLILLASYCLGILAGWTVPDETSSAADRRPVWTYRAALALIFAGFAFFAPLTYGWSLSRAGYDARFWVLDPRL